MFQVWLPSPEGETNITPGDRARQGEETRGRCPPKVSARRALQPKRTHVKIVFMGLTDANQLLLEWRPPGAGLGGSLHPGMRRTPCSSPGVMFVSPSGLGRALVWIVIFWPGRSTGAKWGSRVRNGEKLLVKVANISVTLTSNFYTVP